MENIVVKSKKDCKKISIILLSFLGVEYLFVFLYYFLRIFISFSQTTTSWISVFISAIALFTSFLIGCEICGFKFKKREFHTQFNKMDILSCFLIILGLNLINSCLLSFLTAVFHINTDTSGLTFDGGFSYNLSLIVSALVVAPIFEELLFRGVILRTLARYNDRFAIVVSGILFGLAHMDISQFFFTAILGMVLAYLSLKYKTMIVNIAVHFVNNLWAVLATIVLELNLPTILTNVISIGMSSIALVGVVYLIYVLIHHTKEIFHFEPLYYPYIRWTFFNIPMIAYVLFTCVMMVLTFLS